ncbi:endonuclease MutS2 [Natribacillus halophilus]|uniref:Endonuclease MutS2 n=1 Tax=Natribacillus halophilus TaxID=549003 RepID=A0A1G8LUT4_9BACI|nr:endonuclease MutS2 [Natribacillus halophilus]SDI59438.1 DNA mismatch repair protein MutS2 [Natribacillus halophilus]
MKDDMLRTLEYEKMKDQLLAHVASDLGKARVRALLPHTDMATVRQAQEETAEGEQVLRFRGHAPLGGVHDIRPEINRAQLGSVLDPEDFTSISETIRAGNQLHAFIEQLLEEEEEVSVPRLHTYVTEISPLNQLERVIRQAISEDGYVLDGASATLRTTRQQIRTFESSIRSQLDRILRSKDAETKLSDRVVTIRNERYVLPVKHSYRDAFGGIVHDQSSSGQTLFIEPQAVVTANNQLREARGKEKQEIERILRSLTEEVAAEADALSGNTDILAQLDFIFAKARYAQKMNGVQPRLNDRRYVYFPRARHPLLNAEEVVPIDLEIGDDYQSLVITGPNTGGKTVALKTVGLFTLMAQSGLFLPTAEKAEATVFKHVFADIGDEQSIEQNLSTFSSHMTTIVSILEQVDEQSLVLFDELGAGTDPAEGAALAVSILDEVHERGARTVATTHYTELKGYAYNREGVMNASVEFDVETLRPTYRLLTGMPGRSNAFAISRRLGLSEKIIAAAEGEMAADTKQAEQMITSLEERRQQADQAWEEAIETRQQAEKLHRDLERAFNEWQREKQTIYEQAEANAEAEVEKARKEAEEIVADLRRLQQEGHAVKDHELIEARKNLEEATPQLTEKQQQAKRKAKKMASYEPGEEVFVPRFNQNGQVVEASGKDEYTVQLGIMKMTLNARDLEKTEQPAAQKASKTVTRVSGTQSHVKPELDLRGERYDNAMTRVEKYLDEAVLAGYARVHIIHGKGTGALRKGVKELLASHPSVKGTRDGGQNEGGIGNTVVDLK